MIYIEKIDFKRPSSNKLEQGIRISSDELFRSIVIDSDFNPIVNCTYGTKRKELQVTNELNTNPSVTDENLYVKLNWPEVQKYQDIEGYDDNSYHDPVADIWLINKKWLDEHDT